MINQYSQAVEMEKGDSISLEIKPLKPFRLENLRAKFGTSATGTVGITVTRDGVTHTVYTTGAVSPANDTFVTFGDGWLFGVSDVITVTYANPNDTSCTVTVNVNEHPRG